MIASVHSLPDVITFVVASALMMVGAVSVIVAMAERSASSKVAGRPTAPPSVSSVEIPPGPGTNSGPCPTVRLTRSDT